MAGGKIHAVKSTADFKSQLEQAGEKYVIVDYWATWCGPCVKIAPLFEKLSNEHTNVVFLKVDVDECDEISEEYGVTAMPTFQIFKNGAMVKEWKGANDSKLVEELHAIAQ